MGKDNPKSFFETQDDLETEYQQPTPVKTITSQPIKLPYVNNKTIDMVKAVEGEPDMVPTTL